MEFTIMYFLILAFVFFGGVKFGAYLKEQETKEIIQEELAELQKNRKIILTAKL